MKFEVRNSGYNEKEVTLAYETKEKIKKILYYGVVATAGSYWAYEYVKNKQTPNKESS